MKNSKSWEFCDFVMTSRIEFLKKLDALAGTVMAALLPSAGKAGDIAHPRKILVIRPGGIGDAVLLCPALSALRARYPDVHLTVLAERRNAAAFALCPAVDTVLLYDKPGDFLSALSGRYDVVIDTEQWHRLSAVTARLMRAAVRIGYGTNERSRLFSVPVAYSQEEYEADSFFNLLTPLGISPQDCIPAAPFLSVPDSARKKACHVLDGVNPDHMVVIFPGSSIPERRWGAERFAVLARRLEGEGKCVAVVGGREDIPAGATIAGAAGLNPAGRTSLAETAAIIEGAAVLVSGDSGILHVGVGLGTSTVSLFGPGRQNKWGPPAGTGHAVINHHLECSPCTTFGTTPECPYQARCLSGITVDEVFDAVMTILKK